MSTNETLKELLEIGIEEEIEISPLIKDFHPRMDVLFHLIGKNHQPKIFNAINLEDEGDESNLYNKEKSQSTRAIRSKNTYKFKQIIDEKSGERKGFTQRERIKIERLKDKIEKNNNLKND